MLKLLKTSKRWANYWRKRKIDWQQAYSSTIDHPHREMIVDALAPFLFRSVLEIGCASGPNLMNFLRHWPDLQVGGVDISEDAIRQAKKHMPYGAFEVRDADVLYFSKDCTDATISDACLIYFGPKKVRKALKEINRCTRNVIVLCEFHSTSWFKRLLLRWTSGYFAHDYTKLLEECGFHDVEIRKIPKEVWPGLPWEQYGHIITARVTKL